MKKVITVLIFVLMFSISFAYAEDSSFSVYGGVKFGMSAKDVRSLVGPTFSEYTEFTQKYKDNGIPVAIAHDVEIAGLKGCKVTFAFKDDAVFQVLYDFATLEKGTNGTWTNTYFSKAESDSYYNSIQKMLAKKYGIPAFTYLTEEKVYALYSYASEMKIPFSNCSELINSIEKGMLFNYSCGQVNEWLYPLENGDYVLVDHFQAFNQSSFSKDRYYGNYVLYTYVDGEAVSSPEESNWL